MPHLEELKISKLIADRLNKYVLNACHLADDVVNPGRSCNWEQLPPYLESIPHSARAGNQVGAQERKSAEAPKLPLAGGCRLLCTLESERRPGFQSSGGLAATAAGKIRSVTSQEGKPWQRRLGFTSEVTQANAALSHWA